MASSSSITIDPDNNNSTGGIGNNGGNSAETGFTSAARKFGSYIRLDNETYQSIRQEGQRRLEGLKPWNEFFDRERFVWPKSFADFNGRLNYNLRHYQNNYLLVVLLIIAYFLITEPWLLVSVVFLVGGFKFISALSPNEPWTVPGAGTQVTQMQLWIAYGVISLLLLFFTGISSTLFWVATVCGAVVCAHAGVMDKTVEAEFGDDQV